jgi:SAM-dependent methyltransferase
MNGRGNHLSDPISSPDLEKAALRGEPSYVWRAGQERRLNMIVSAAGEHIKGRLLENGCGIGMYLKHLAPHASTNIGLEVDLERARVAYENSPYVVNSISEQLPFCINTFDVILSHEVLEHVSDDRGCIEEMVRVLNPGGVIVLFVPNLGYPFETHGIYWRGRYRFGNIPLVHYLPKRIRNQLMPHVRAYSSQDIHRLFLNLPVKVVRKQVIFGAYDNIINRFPTLGRILRSLLQWLENTPLRIFGLSHFWVIEKE